MLYAYKDEPDEDQDEEEEDADPENENGEEDDSEEDDKDDDSDDSEDDDEDSDEEDDSEDDEEDEDSKPVTRKELREALKGKNKGNAQKRLDSKKDKKEGRDTKLSDADRRRLDALEDSDKQRRIAEKKLDFASEHGLSKKQVNHVFRLTKRPTGKFLNKPHVKAALDAIKSQEGVARNTPSGSGKRFKSPGGKKWTELSAEDRQSSLASRRNSILAKQGKR